MTLKAYSDEHEKNAENYPYLDNFDKDGPHWHRTSFFLEYIKPKDKILDCGCSNGGLSKYLTENIDCTVFAFDIATFFVKNTHKNAPKAICARFPIENIPFVDEVFDVVIVGEILEHVLNEKKAINEILRILKKDGYLLLTTPSPEDSVGDRHLRYLGKKELEMLLPGIDVRYNQYSWLSCYKKPKFERPTISLAMIVKDEEKVLARCLDSVKDVVDEIIVVDTGSKDKTKEIAKKYTNKVYDFKWVDDFSKARNFSFSKCTKDFILWIDADDVIKEEDRIKIKNLDLTDKNIVISDYQYFVDEFGNSDCTVPRERILRRSLKLKWQAEIHETISVAKYDVFISDISIYHYRQSATSERNLKVLERIVKKDKNNARNVFYLGKEYFEFGKIDSAIKYLKRFINMRGGWWEDKYNAYYFLAQCYQQKNLITKFKQSIFKSLEIEERRAEPYYLMGNYYFKHQKWEKAIHWYEVCKSVKRPKELLASYRPSFHTWKPALQLCVCYNAIGDIKKAYEYNQEVLKYRPTDSRAINNENILLNAINRKNDGENKRLNLGCGNKTLDGYVNVDVVKTEWTDEVFSLNNIPYTDNSISAIYCEHALEHLSHEESGNAIKEWIRVLNLGGELLLFIPDLELCCKYYLDVVNNNIGFVNGFPSRDWYKYTIFGYQKDANGVEADYQFHYTGFSKKEIRELLEANGFIIDYLENYDGYKTPSIGIRALKPISNLKIGWIAPINWDAAQTRIRVLRIDGWLHSRGYNSRIVNYPEIINQNYDVAIVGKGFDEHHYKNIKMLKRHGKTVFCDLCEDILEFSWVNDILRICDKIICCSYKLEKKVKKINSNTIVIEDAYET